MYGHSEILGVSRSLWRRDTASPSLRKPSHDFGINHVQRSCIACPAAIKSEWRQELRAIMLYSSIGPGETPPLKRSEVVHLLQLAVETLLLPENQKRLKQRLQGKKGKKISERTAEIQRSTFPFHQALAIDTSERTDALVSERLSVKNSLEVPESKLSHASTIRNVEDTKDAQSKSIDDRRDNSLTDIRKLKVLNVHSYVHNALRQSAVRSWLQDRKIEE